MLPLSHATFLSLLRSMAAQHGVNAQTDMLPAAGTPARVRLEQVAKRFFCLDPSFVLPDTSITLDEWAATLAQSGGAHALMLGDFSATEALSVTPQCACRHAGDALAQEADSLLALLAAPPGGERTLVSWLPLQSMTGFMLGALVPQRAGWLTRSLFDHANALWELQAGDIMVTSEERWRQLAKRLPALPEQMTAVSTGPLDEATYQALLDQGVADIIELYGEPSLGVMAARRSSGAPFKLLTHLHPTESTHFLIRMVTPSVPQEIELKGVLRWVGSRHFEVLTDRAVQVRVPQRRATAAPVAADASAA